MLNLDEAQSSCILVDMTLLIDVLTRGLHQYYIKI